MTNVSIRKFFAVRGRYLAAFALASTGAALLSMACSSDPRDGFEESKAEQPSFADAGALLPEAGEDSKCLSDTVEAQRVPLAMLVLLDRSGSMTDSDKWQTATKAIRAFADRTDVVGMNMGLQFFPPILAGDECSASTYKTPAVAIAELPDNVIPIQQKVDAADPDGGTPMRSGLEGSIAAMRSFIQAHEPHSGAVILVTDGDPNLCGGIAEVATVASDGANPPAGVPRVTTFAVGMQGATFANLNQIAAAGEGAPTAFDVGGGAASQQALIDALDAVRTSAIACEFVLPTPDSSKGVLDPNSVDVLFTPGKNDPTETIRKVASKDGCGATTGGYYYDDPNSPTKVILCPASCDVVGKATSDAKVELSLGCIVKPH